MLPEATDTEMRTLGMDQDLGPQKALARMRHEFAKKAKAHNHYAHVWKAAYFSLGGVGVLTAVVMGAVDGCEHPDLVTGMSLLVAILTTALNFFGAESRIQKHEASRGQYETLCMELERYRLTTKYDPATATQLEKSCYDRLKVITQCEPDLSGCLDCCL